MPILEKQVIVGQENVSLVESKISNGISLPLIVKKTIGTVDFMQNLSRNIGCVGTILPKNCRYIFPVSSDTTVVVIEEQPKLRSVRFLYDFCKDYREIITRGQEYLNASRFLKEQKRPYILRLSFPYVVYIILIQKEESDFVLRYFNVFFRKHPIKRLNDYLNIANIFNLNDNNNLCFGRIGKFSRNNYPFLSDVIDYLIASFWNKPFTSEYKTRHEMYCNNAQLHSFLIWAHYSETDPMFIYSANLIMHKRNIKEEIDWMLHDIGSISKSTEYKKLFIDSLKSTKKIPNNPSVRYTYDTLSLDDYILAVGDNIKYNNREDFYIHDIFGNYNKATHVTLIDNQGNVTEPIELTEDIYNDWKIQCENKLNNYVEVIKIGKEIIKVGSIVKIIPTNRYEIVEKIRLSRDNKYELVFGNRFYIAREGVFSVIDSFDVNGVKLKPGYKYLICDNRYQRVFKGRFTRVKNAQFVDILYFFFKDLETDIEREIYSDLIGTRITINYIDDSNIIPVFRYLNRLYTNNDKYIITHRKVYIKYDDNESSPFPSTYNSNNPNDIINHILQEEGKQLSIPGVDIDINFKVGDEVIICDWKNPEDLMFKIRRIIGFEYDTDSNILFFKLVDSNGIKMKVEYINIENGFIKVGYIRKVQSKYDGIVVGSRARAITSGYFLFPKRTNYEIAAFIIDGPNPMVLFKDGLTIWFHDLRRNFEVFAPGTKEYKRIRSVRLFNSYSIPWQSGDLCEKEGKIYVLNKSNKYIGLIYMNIDPDYIKMGSLRRRVKLSREIDPSFCRYGIMCPRYRKKDSVVVEKTIPTFHNGYTKVPYNGYYPFTIKYYKEGRGNK